MVFLPITFLGFLFFSKTNEQKGIIPWLSLCSLFFYAYWKIEYVLIILVSIIVNFYISKRFTRDISNIQKKGFLLFGLIINLGALGYYKYTTFLVENIVNVFSLDWSIPQVVLPLGISFFTFQQVGYLVDAYKGKERELNFVNYFFFVTFFPQLIAGPIVHHSQILPQVRKKLGFDYTDFSLGVTLFTTGLFKKVIIADNISKYSSDFFGHALRGGDFTSADAWVGALCYTFQIYFDFSGYSDMAIGLGRLFGIKIPINFNSPYKALNIVDFWRRWHITLSHFLRDYLYIPLGGNRNGNFRRYLNLFLTMLLGGIWHGAGWSFLLWGALHGSALAVNNLWGELRIAKRLQNNFGFGWRGVSRILTFLFVLIAWVPFRADNLDISFLIYKKMAMFDFSNSIVFEGILRRPLRICLILSLIAFFVPNIYQITKSFSPMFENVKILAKSERLFGFLSWKPSTFFGILFGIIFALTYFELLKVSEFLYFQF